MLRQQQQEEETNNDYYYSNYVNALKSKTTKLDYTRRLKYFMDFMGFINYSQLVEIIRTTIRKQ